VVILMGEQVVTLPDGRKLGYCTVGKGQPVIYFHGTASSRLEVLLLKDFADKAGLQIVGFDRPGYGLSTYRKRQSLQDFNGDINYLADYLCFKRFSILSWSGGGPFALAYLSQYSERVDKAVVAAAPSLPFDVSTAHNFPLAKYVMKLPFAGAFAMRHLRRQVLKASGNPSAFLESTQGKQLLRGYSKTDQQFFSDSVWAGLMHQSMAEAFRYSSGVNAVVEEHILFVKPWGFTFEGISGGKLVILHGVDDKTCRVSNAYALARLVCGSELLVFGGQGHCVLFENFAKLAEILALQ
jgi:pimeloyl-ACP methyl ester carboxylesterase